MLSTLKYSVYPLIAPAITSSVILLGANMALGKSQVNWNETLYDVGGLFVAQISASIIVNIIPTFSSSKYGYVVESAEAYLLIPVLSTLIYEWLYGNTIRRDYDNYSSSLKDPALNMMVGFGSVFASNIVQNNLMDWLL